MHFFSYAAVVSILIIAAFVMWEELIGLQGFVVPGVYSHGQYCTCFVTMCLTSYNCAYRQAARCLLLFQTTISRCHFILVQCTTFIATLLALFSSREFMGCNNLQKVVIFSYLLVLRSKRQGWVQQTIATLSY